MEFDFDLARYVEVLTRWLWLIVVTTVLAAAATWAIGKSGWQATVPVYEAEADVAAIKPVGQLNAPSEYKTLSDSGNVGSSILLGIARSSDLASAVLAEMGTALAPGSRGVAALLNSVQVSAEGDLIRIRVQNPDARQAAAIANTWAKLLNVRVNQLYTENPTSVDQLQARAGQAWNEYQSAEGKLAQFRANNQIEATTREIAAKHNTLDDLYTTARNLERLLQDSKALQDSIVRNPSLSNDASSRLAVLLIRANAATLAFASTNVPSSELGTTGFPVTVGAASTPSGSGGTSNSVVPSASALQLQIQWQSALLNDPSQPSVPAQVDALVALLDARKKQIAAQLSDSSLQNQVLALQKQLEEQQAAQQELVNAREAAWASYKAVSGKLADVRLSQQPAGSILRLAASAVVPVTPLPSRADVNLTPLGALAGLVLGILLAFLLEYLDKTARSPRDVANALGLPVFEIPANGAGPLSGLDPSATATVSPGPAYYQLWASLSSELNSQKCLLVSGVVSGEGRSTTAASLAVIAAQAGKSVILVDADRLNPSVHTRFGLPNDRGWSNLLQGEQDDSSYLQRTRIPNLRVITSGPVHPLAPGLVSPQVAAVIRSLKAQADLIIVDSPPTARTADAFFIAQCADAVLLSARARHTPRQALLQLKEQLVRLDSHILGVVAVQGKTGVQALVDRVGKLVPSRRGRSMQSQGASRSGA